MKKLTALLEDTCSYFCEKYGCDDIFEVYSFNNGSFLGKVHVLNISQKPDQPKMCIVLGENSIKLLWDTPNPHYCERLTGEVIGADVETFGGEGSLVVYPSDKSKGVRCIMFQPRDKFLSDLKLEFLAKINELFYSGKYSLEVLKEVV